jgi:hypothetical protein
VAAETRDGFMLRFLRARKFAVKAAQEMLLQDVAWREGLQLNETMSQTAEDVLGCPVRNVWPFSASWLQGQDRQGRPVIYKVIDARSTMNFTLCLGLKMLCPCQHSDMVPASDLGVIPDLLYISNVLPLLGVGQLLLQQNKRARDT